MIFCLPKTAWPPTFTVCDEAFPERALSLGQSFIVGGSNYGQGSSREHAALAPLYLGIKAVIVKSFARIHRANLINAGILPLEFVNEADYDTIDEADVLSIDNLYGTIMKDGVATVVNKTKGTEFKVKCDLSDRMKAVMTAGGLLEYTKAQLNK